MQDQKTSVVSCRQYDCLFHQSPLVPTPHQPDIADLYLPVTAHFSLPKLPTVPQPVDRLPSISLPLLTGYSSRDCGRVDEEAEKLAVVELSIAVEVAVLELALVNGPVTIKQFTIAVEEACTVLALVRPPLAEADSSVPSFPSRRLPLLLHHALLSFLRALFPGPLDGEIFAVQLGFLREGMEVVKLLLGAVLRFRALRGECVRLAELIY